MVRFKLFYEAGDKLITLYHIGTQPPYPRPLGQYSDEHPRLKNYPYNTGAWLTDTPDKSFNVMLDELEHQTIARAKKQDKWVDKHGMSKANKGPQILKMWVVKVPSQIVRHLGGVQQHAFSKDIREIAIPIEYWGNVIIQRSKDPYKAFKKGDRRLTYHQNADKLYPGMANAQYNMAVRKLLRHEWSYIKKNLKMMGPKYIKRFKEALNSIIRHDAARLRGWPESNTSRKAKRILKKLNKSDEDI